MRPTLLLPLLLALVHTTYAFSESGRFLASCTEGCLSCHTATNTCLRCEDDLVLINGACFENFVYKDMIYVKGDHYLLVDIDNNGVDIAVIVIFSILAFVVYLGSLFLMQKEDWKELVPEPKEATKAGEGKEAAKQPTPKGTPKGDQVIEMGQTELGHSPTPKSATPGSPVKSAGQSSHRSKTVQEDGEGENIPTSPAKQNDFDDEEEEEPYYPTKKELATRNRKDQIREGQDEEEEDGEQVDIQVHDGEVQEEEEEEEDEQKTAQETPSPKTDIRSTPKGRASHHKRKGSNHSDAEYEDDEDRPQPQSNIKNNQHRGNEGEEEDEEFESARSHHGHAQYGEEEEEEEQEEEQQEEEEEEEEQEDNDVMDLNDLGLDNGEKKH